MVTFPHGCLSCLWLEVSLICQHRNLRDGLALHYKKPLLSLPCVCNDCGASFSIEHALDCHFGGLVGCRHNEVQDAFGDLASLVWAPVIKEPVVH